MRLIQSGRAERIPHSSWGLGRDRTSTMNLLDEPVLSHSRGETVSLPGLFAAMARQEATGFPALRPHQRPAWHMFLVQLGALAISRAGFDHVPDDEATWRAALGALTSDHPDESPWRLATLDWSRPAFLQPPEVDGARWSPVRSPDDLDMLITSRNHDIKQNISSRASAEDWVYALVSLQTCEGYSGRGNYGIARMNGGSSSRPMLGLAPASAKDMSADPSVWWKRDVSILTRGRKHDPGSQVGRVGGPALLWCLDWPEGHQLNLLKLDPLFIEICRRVRLRESDGKLLAFRANSKAARIDAKAFKGNVGDPWSPIDKKHGKSFTLSGGEFNYKKLVELLFSGNWKRPLLSTPSEYENDEMLLIAEAFSRGNSKTEGFKSRVVAAPRQILSVFESETAATLSKAQMDDIKVFDVALRNALALVAARGDRTALKADHYRRGALARKRFDRAADKRFFPILWLRLAAIGQDKGTEQAHRKAFLTYLHCHAKKEFDTALASIPCPALLRPRAESRGRREFQSRVRAEFPELSEADGNNAAI